MSNVAIMRVLSSSNEEDDEEEESLSKCKAEIKWTK